MDEALFFKFMAFVGEVHGECFCCRCLWLLWCENEPLVVGRGG